MVNIFSYFIKFIVLSFLYLFVYSSIFNVYILGKQFLFTLLASLTMYWIASIFIFLINVSYFKGLPSAVSRFWRRGIMLFWGIEMFLCACYIFVILNCAIETEWMAQQQQLLLNNDNIINGVILQILSCVCLILSSIYLMRSNITQNSFTNIILLVLYFLVLVNIIEEFYQFFYHVNSYFQYKYIYDVDEMCWEYSLNNNPSLIIRQYYFLVVFLKFWHAFLVYSGFVYTIRLISSNSFNNINLTSLKLSVVNFNFLLVFALLPFLFYIKLILQVFGFYVYFWFGVNIITNVSLFDILSFLF